eukprot:m.358863 g.358863  ORF g.358863 m.358863 type:complete len:76 (+) comp19948_c0_seq1:190-417(+)
MASSTSPSTASHLAYNFFERPKKNLKALSFMEFRHTAARGLIEYANTLRAPAGEEEARQQQRKRPVGPNRTTTSS